jgi:hypothetical protein
MMIDDDLHEQRLKKIMPNKKMTTTKKVMTKIYMKMVGHHQDECDIKNDVVVMIHSLMMMITKN